jgi:glucose/arabinose dehydrogenase
MIVSEKPGAIRIISTTGKVGNPIANVPPARNVGDAGLLDLKLDPEFASTRLVFWSYVKDSARTGRNIVMRARLSKDETSLENVTEIFRGTDPYSGPNHNGSRMIFDKDGLLYVTFGERFDDSIRIQAQHLNSSLGKIIRINKDGTEAAGNPFIKVAGDLPQIFSYGHRNPQGLAFNPVTGDLWESEHGPQAGDEINIIKPGGNYGWPIIAYGLEYSDKPVNGTGLTQKPGMEQPVYYWDPSIAPSGIIFYTGSLIPEWRNNLFVAALGGMHIARLVIKDNKVIGEERLLTEEHRRFRDVVQGPDGALYAITDDDDGRIYRIGK